MNGCAMTPHHSPPGIYRATGDLEFEDNSTTISVYRNNLKYWDR